MRVRIELGVRKNRGFWPREMSEIMQTGTLNYWINCVKR